MAQGGGLIEGLATIGKMIVEAFKVVLKVLELTKEFLQKGIDALKGKDKAASSHKGRGERGGPAPKKTAAKGAEAEMGDDDRSSDGSSTDADDQELDPDQLAALEADAKSQAEGEVKKQSEEEEEKKENPLMRLIKWIGEKLGLVDKEGGKEGKSSGSGPSRDEGSEADVEGLAAASGIDLKDVDMAAVKEAVENERAEGDEGVEGEKDPRTNEEVAELFGVDPAVVERDGAEEDREEGREEDKRAKGPLSSPEFKNELEKAVAGFKKGGAKMEEDRSSGARVATQERSEEVAAGHDQDQGR